MQVDDCKGMSPILAPKAKDALKDEPSQNNHSKSLPSGSAKGTPSTKSSKSKRKLGTDYVKSPNDAPAKKIKTENVCLEIVFFFKFAQNDCLLYLMNYLKS